MPEGELAHPPDHSYSLEADKARSAFGRRSPELRSSLGRGAGLILRREAPSEAVVTNEYHRIQLNFLIDGAHLGTFFLPIHRILTSLLNDGSFPSCFWLKTPSTYR